LSCVPDPRERVPVLRKAEHRQRGPPQLGLVPAAGVHVENQPSEKRERVLLV
jgi:hypothetical protein